MGTKKFCDTGAAVERGTLDSLAGFSRVAMSARGAPGVGYFVSCHIRLQRCGEDRSLRRLRTLHFDNHVVC